MDMNNLPECPPASLARSREAVRTKGSTSSANFNRRLPADVNRIGRVLRMKSVQPSRSSKSLSWWDNADWVR